MRLEQCVCVCVCVCVLIHTNIIIQIIHSKHGHCDGWRRHSIKEEEVQIGHLFISSILLSFIIIISPLYSSIATFQSLDFSNFLNRGCRGLHIIFHHLYLLNRKAQDLILTWTVYCVISYPCVSLCKCFFPSSPQQVEESLTISCKQSYSVNK